MAQDLKKNGNVVYPNVAPGGTVGQILTKTENGQEWSTLNISETDPNVVFGYLYDSNFYEDITHTEAIPGVLNKLYIDKILNKLYVYSGLGFVELGSSSPSASERDYPEEKLVWIEGTIQLEASSSLSGFTASSVGFAPLKYNKTIAISTTLDDQNATSFCNAWAGINGRAMAKQDSPKYYIHANQYLGGDTPEAVLGTTPESRLLYPDTFGGSRRFTHTSALWPSVRNNSGTPQIDTTSDLRPGYTENYYRFMNPYLQWGDCSLMMKYGVDFCLHDISEDDFGPSEIKSNIIRGLKEDIKRVHNNLGIWVKSLAEPNGNHVYVDAVKEMASLEQVLNQSGDALSLIPYSSSASMYDQVYKRYFDDVEVAKGKIDALMQLPENERTWYVLGIHSVGDEFYNFLKYIYDNYGNDAWVCSAGEIYEYQYFKAYGRTQITSQGLVGNSYNIGFKVGLPVKDCFRYKDVTINIPVSSIASGLHITGFNAHKTIDNVSIKEAQYKVDEDNSRVVLHLGINDDLEQNIEYFVSRYEATSNDIWKEDAMIDLSRLLPQYAQPYTSRLNVTVVNPTGISITGDSSIDHGDIASYTVTVLPSDCTRVSQAVISPSSGNVVSKIILGNTITFGVSGAAVGTLTVSVSIDSFSDSISTTVNATVSPNLVISSASIVESSLTEGDDATLSWTCLRGGVPASPQYFKLWSNLESEPVSWSSISGDIVYENVSTGITSLSLKVADDSTGLNESTAYVITGISVSPEVTPPAGNAPIYMLPFYLNQEEGGYAIRNAIQSSVLGGYVNGTNIWSNSSVYRALTGTTSGNELVDLNGNATGFVGLNQDDSKTCQISLDVLAICKEFDSYARLNPASRGDSFINMFSEIISSTLSSTNISENDISTTMLGNFGLFSYGDADVAAMVWNCPNGTYKVSLLSGWDTGAENNEWFKNGGYHVDSGKIFINRVDVTSQLGNISFDGNTTWSNEITTTVTDGMFGIHIYNPRSGDSVKRDFKFVNGVKITKIS